MVVGSLLLALSLLTGPTRFRPAPGRTSGRTFGSAAYVESLWESGIVSEGDLRALAKGKAGSSERPITVRNTETLIHARELEERLAHPRERAAISSWARGQLLAIKASKGGETSRGQPAPSPDLDFIRVGTHLPKVKLWSPFSYQIGATIDYVPKRPFEFGTTLVTQGQWLKRRDYNPSRFKLSLRHPVDSVGGAGSDPSMVEGFLEALNREDPRHDYRLPTPGEWLYVLTDAGRNRLGAFGNGDLAELLAHEWLSENSGGTTHEVATRAPRYFDGQPVFDQVGLLGEVVNQEGEKRSLGKSFAGEMFDHLGFQNLHQGFQTPPEHFGVRVVRERRASR